MEIGGTVPEGNDRVYITRRSIITAFKETNAMTSRETVKRIVAHEEAPRFAWEFSDRRYNDFQYVGICRHLPEAPNPYNAWGRYEDLIAQTGFSGEVRKDRFGNIYGRFNGKTKGECIRGCIEDWEEDFGRYAMPVLDRSFRDELQKCNYSASEKYVVGGISSIFSLLRDARLISNALADTITDPEYVTAFIDRVVDYICEVIGIAADCGIDAVFTGDDWGTQDRTFISPVKFEELFYPGYKRMCDAAHNAGMSVFMHSCGYIYEFIPILSRAGIDVFQFDQPDVYPSEVLAEEFGKTVAFDCPVDIQRVMPTGDIDLITKRAVRMCDIFRETCGGAMIFRDYPSWGDIGVDEAWATAARTAIVENSSLS